MKASLVNRAVGTAAVLSLAVTLAGCGSSGGSGGKTGAKTASKASSSSASSSNAAPSVALPSGTGDAKLPSGQPGKGKPAVTMGDKNFAEEFLLGALYSEALKARGYSVTLKGNIGTSAVIDKALTSGQIDLYPEYTGVIYTELAGLGQRPKSATATLDGATKFQTKRGFAVLNPTPFQDADGVAVSKSYASKNGLKTISDLTKAGPFTYGGPPENGTRFQGVVGLKQAYGLSKIQFKPLPIGGQYQALDQGKVDSIAIFTTDGQLASGKYAVLPDTKGIFGFQQVVPVVSQKVLKAEGPEFQATLNAVSATLTTAAIVALNKAVQIDQQDPTKVAKAFLQANHLL